MPMLSVIAKVSLALRRAGYNDSAQWYRAEAIKGDFDQLPKSYFAVPKSGITLFNNI